MSEDLLNTAEAARFLRVSEASIRRWTDAGLLESSRVGRRRERRFTEADLLHFLERGPRSAMPARTVSLGGAAITPPGHFASFYSTDAGALRLSVPFLAEGLKAGEPSFLFASGPLAERYLAALGKVEGVDLGAALSSGGLVLVGMEAATVLDSIAYWETTFAGILAGSPAVIRVVGEMACERSMFVSDEEMLRYEEAFDVMCRRYPAVTMCQYDAREFNGGVILRALKAHPDLYGVRLGAFLH